MAINTDEVVRLNADLLVVETSIKNIVQTGQNFKKGGSTGFAVEQVRLSELRKERSELRAKLAMWGLYV